MSRQTETRLNVVRVLDEYLHGESIERVRVSRLCQMAGISRTTFYEYFDDVYAVATWMWDHVMEGTLYQAGRRYGCYEAHLRKFEALREHKEFFMRAFTATGYESLAMHGGRMMTRIVTRVVEDKSGHELTDDERLSLEFFMTGAKHMTDYWIGRGMRESPERMAALFTEHMPAFALPYLEPDPGYGPPDLPGTR